MRRQWRIHMAKSLGQRAKGENWTRRCGRGGDNSADKKSRKKDQERGMTGTCPELGLACKAKLRQVRVQEWRLWKMRDDRYRDARGICNCLSPMLKQKHRFSSLLILQSCANQARALPCYFCWHTQKMTTQHCFQLLSRLNWQRIMQCI